MDSDGVDGELKIPEIGVVLIVRVSLGGGGWGEEREEGSARGRRQGERITVPYLPYPSARTSERASENETARQTLSKEDRQRQPWTNLSPGGGLAKPPPALIPIRLVSVAIRLTPFSPIRSRLSVHAPPSPQVLQGPQ